MARQIKLNQIDDVMKEVVIDLVQATTLEWTARTKKATPVFSLDNYPDLDSIPNFFTLPNGQVVPFKKSSIKSWGWRFTSRSMANTNKTIKRNNNKQSALCRACLFWNKFTAIMGWSI